MGQLPAELALDELDRGGGGGAPAVNRRTPRGAPALTSSGALAMEMSTVGAAQNMVMRSSRMRRNTAFASTCRRQTWAMPRAVLIQVKVQPLAWNIGSVHR